MDREISRSEQMRTKMKPIVLTVLVATLLLLGLRWGAVMLRPQLKRGEIMTAKVERGPVTAAIETTGVLEPAREIVLSAPANTRVLRVLKRPGSVVSSGESILELDTSELELAAATTRQDLQVRENTKARTELRYGKETRELNGRLELARLDLAFLEARYKQQQQLFEQGLASLEEVEQAKLTLDKTRVEKQQIEESLRESSAERQAELDGLDLELALLRRSLEQAENDLVRASALAPEAGILTWVAEEEGSAVTAGSPLARIADLSDFKVLATISDFYAQRLRTGQEVSVRIGNQEIPGRVERLLPEVTDGSLSFEVRFQDQPGFPLRPNQRVTVYLRTERREETLRVKRGPAIPGPGNHEVYVIKGDKAVRTPVQAGVTGLTYTEIISGLEPGEVVILTELQRFGGLSSIPLK